MTCVLGCLKSKARDLEKFLLYSENFPDELIISARLGTEDSEFERKCRISSAERESLCSLASTDTLDTAVSPWAKAFFYN